MEPETPKPPPPPPPPLEIHMVAAVDSPELRLLQWALRRSPVVALDAEWKPSFRCPTPSFPSVSLLQIACRVARRDLLDRDAGRCGDFPVFLVDLLSVPMEDLWETLRDMFVSPHVLKLGFRFKQDLAYLSATFSAQASVPGFDLVEPFIDITTMYHLLKNQNIGKKLPKETKSLATICEEILNVSLSKELQCSDWSRRPLTEEQISYAAVDAYCLLEIFAVFQHKYLNEGRSSSDLTGQFNTSNETVGLKEILEESDLSYNILQMKFCNASDMVRSSACNIHLSNKTALATTSSSFRAIFPLDECISNIVRKYGDRIQLKESDKRPKTSRRKGRRQSSGNAKCKGQLEYNGDWQGPPPWDPAFGGDGCPKFLCDVMVEGLARHLRCVGIDAAIPFIKKPEPRQLLDQAYKEKRVLLTRDAKLLKHHYLVRNQIYRVKNLLKNDQLLEVIQTFRLKISEEQLMSRCTKCNGSFIQKPLTIEEAIAASKGFQVIPQCLFNCDLEFWQCRDCKQLYWEGTQYHNAVQKFVTVCKLND